MTARLGDSEVYLPMRGDALRHKGDALMRLGRSDEAASAYQEAAHAYATVFPYGHPLLAAALGKLGRARLEVGNYTDAHDPLRRAAQIAELDGVAVDLRDKLAVEANLILAEAHMELRTHEEAVKELRELRVAATDQGFDELAGWIASYELEVQRPNE